MPLPKRILAHVGDRPCYLTFDIDCLDPAFAPAPAHRLRRAFSARMLSVLRKLGGLDIRGADIVEVAPPMTTDITAIAGATIAMYMLGLRPRGLRPALRD